MTRGIPGTGDIPEPDRPEAMNLNDPIFRGELIGMLSDAQSGLDAAWHAVMNRQPSAAHLSVRRAKETLARLEERLRQIPVVMFTQEGA